MRLQNVMSHKTIDQVRKRKLGWKQNKK